MLKTIRRIIQEVNATYDFSDALKIIVSRVREAMSTEACTVFLVDSKQNEYVLVATDGLNPNAVGHIRLKQNQGLVGLVGEREELINLEDAPSHPNFYHHEEIGEERLKAFLAAPIMHHRQLLGILVVQQQEQRRFDEAEEAFLITMSAQLAGVIAHAKATGEIHRLLNTHNLKNGSECLTLTGAPSAPGIGFGLAVVVYPLADLAAVPDKTITDIAAEIIVLNEALESTREDIRMLSARLSNSLPPEELALFDVYSKILDSSSLFNEITEYIEQGDWAQGALRKVAENHMRQFEAMEDAYLRERGADLYDLATRILSHLQSNQITITNYPEQTVLVGVEVTAAKLAEVPEGRLVGIVSEKGSSNSHVAILARALGVPCVMGVTSIDISDLEGKEIIVDGYQGQAYITPAPTTRIEFLKLAEQQRELDESLEALHNLPAQTQDGHHISLFVNTGLAIDAGLSLTAGAEGIGLFRTEVPFMMRERFPAEEEQRIIYRQLLQSFAPRPVVMRMLDVGGDKALPYFPVVEDNPFLGWRGIRITLDHPEVFLMQARAMLRANAELNNLQIMFPMITTVSEVDEALNLIDQAYHEVVEEGARITKPPIGVMIEVPSAVYQAKAIASRVDFLSVGSNDLTQYLLAVDRNNSRVANLYDSLHPAILHALIQTVECAHQAHKKVSICGELAGDPIGIILLLAMGFDALSMNPASIPRVKWVIRNMTITNARQILNEVLTMENPKLIRRHLEKALEAIGLGQLIHTGR